MPVQVDRDSRKQIRLENTRRTILDAARKVFARDGIEAATMQDIAAEAGYGAPALYNYFPSKDEIVDVILSEVTARSLETLSRPLGDGEDFRAYFVSLIADLLRLAEEDRSVLSLVLSLGEAAGKTGELMQNH
ncbi:MAG: TetR/AcrR family transcriptional regulator, partial [bacterium]|nr:TetR/AcrR family transcriptional regulator [bacterium]